MKNDPTKGYKVAYGQKIRKHLNHVEFRPWKLHFELWPRHEFGEVIGNQLSPFTYE